LPGSAFVRPNEARHIQTAFPAFAKRPGTPSPPEMATSPGLLAQQPGMKIVPSLRRKPQSSSAIAGFRLVLDPGFRRGDGYGLGEHPNSPL
jgi:hypothetical protein